jgi:hypothetical protein
MPRAGGASSKLQPIVSFIDVSGILDPRLRGMTIAYEATFSRRIPPELCIFVCPLEHREGAGKTGCALHPRSRVQLRTGERAHEHTGSAGASRPSLRNGFTTYSVLSPVRRALLPPSPATALLLRT